MSDELRALLHASAPAPRGSVDVRGLERRARRIVLTRFAAATLSAAVVAAGVTVVARIDVADRPVADPVPQRPPDDVEVRHRESRVPPGPRYEVVSGVFGDDWEEDAGLRWRLLVWGRGRTSCWQVATEESERNESLACTHADPDQVRETKLGGSTSFLTQSEDPDEYHFVAGYVGPRVDRLEFRGDRGPDRSIPLHRPPPEAGSPFRYYATTLPRYDFAQLVALSERGRALESHRLCGAGCREQREREAATEVVAFEHAPVTVESAAAAFAVAAAAQAGVMDELGTFWSYRGISGEDDYVATFSATDCSGADAYGGYRCDPDHEPATVRVAIEDDRFVVAGAKGPMTDEQRGALESYWEPVTDDVRRWRQVTFSFARTGPREWDVSFLMVWTGNLDAPRDYGSACRFVVYAARRETLHRSPLLAFEVGRDEQEFRRVSGLMTTIETRRVPRDLLVECDDPAPGLMERLR